MGDISYICFSDMHLGEEDSLLSVPVSRGINIDPLMASPVMKSLVACLEELISHNQTKRPVLILNGDILELALATTNKAAMVFDRFIELTMRKDGGNKPLFEDIILIPGNHDHHLWETARESQYINYLQKMTDPSIQLEDARHTTNLFLHRQKIEVPCNMLTRLLQRYQYKTGYEHLAEKSIVVHYPGLGLLNEDKTRCVIFDHGHYIEQLYHMMTYLKETFFPSQKRQLNSNEIETENFAWIDFVWSSLGRQGDVGRDVETIYEKLFYEKGRLELVDKLSGKLAEQINTPGIWKSLEQRIIKQVMKWGLQHPLNSLAERERTQEDKALSSDAEKGLTAYMEYPLRMKVINENHQVPGEVTFVFGHTHKPFQDVRQFKGYPGMVKVYNTGGWVVETFEHRETNHGASVVLVDDELNTTSIRMYNEAESPSLYRVKVEQASTQNNPFHERIKNLVESPPTPEAFEKWRTFSREAAKAVEERSANLQYRAQAAGYL